MGSRWRIRRFRSGPQSEPRGHVSSTRSPVAGVRLASKGVRSLPPVAPVAERSGGFARGRASTPIRTGSARAIAPPPGSPGARTDTDCPTAAACARQAFRGTLVVARRNALAGSSLTTPSGPARPFRLASVPRPGMTKTDIRLGTHPGPDPERPSLRSEHYLADAVADQCARIHRLRLDRSADRFTGSVA